MTLLEYLTFMGASIVSFIWVPLLIWTFLAGSVLAILRFCQNLHVLYHYHIRLALLLALPIGLLFTGLAEFVANSSIVGIEASTSLKFLSLKTPDVISVSASESANLLPSPRFLYGIGMGVFLIGTVLQLFRIIRQYLRLRILTKRIQLNPIESINGINDTNKILYTDCKKPVSITFLNGSVSPATYGRRKPVILLPTELKSDPDKMNLVLRHELIHIKNHDYTTQLMMSGLSALFWIHPLVHLISTQLIVYREMRCDDHVLADNSISRKKYASVLLDLLQMPTLNKNVSVNMAQESSNLKRRINMIKTKNTRLIPFKASLALFSGVVGVTVLIMSCTDLQSETEPTILGSESELQKSYNQENDFYVVAEKMPELIGGLSGVQEDLEYPEEARKKGLEGRVYVQFIVDKTGDVKDARVIRGIGTSADEAALKAVRQAKFRPGFIRGEPVRIQYSLPIEFKLAPSSENNGV